MTIGTYNFTKDHVSVLNYFRIVDICKIDMFDNNYISILQMPYIINDSVLCPTEPTLGLKVYNLYRYNVYMS